MKKIIIFLLVSLLFITNVYAEGSVEIKSIDLDSKSETTTELNRPKFNGLEMNYDLRFKNVNDFAKYKIVIKNNTNKDYKVSEDTSFKVSEYVTYKYETSQTIKANSETTVNIIITYTSGVESSNYENGVFNESNKAVLELRDEDGNIVNPKTGSLNKVLILGVVAILSTIVLIFLMNKKSAFFVLVIFLVLSPVLLKATEELKVTMNVKVQISIRPTYKVSYNIKVYAYNSNDTTITINSELGGCSNITVYIGSQSEENKYTMCYGAIVDDPVKYEAGDLVNIKQIEASDFPSISYEEESDSSVVEIINETTRIYHKPLGKKLINRWDYICYNEAYMENIGYKCDSINDKTVMKFNSLFIDQWDELKNISVQSPGTFIMPSHNVLLQEYYPLA